MTVSATEVATLCTVPTLALQPYTALILLQVLHEGCSANNATITLLRSITAKSLLLNKRLLYQCHTTGGMDEDTVAAFLIGAGVDHYIASGGWAASGKNPINYWSPILAKPLGAPTAAAVYDNATTTWTRSFGSGTVVTFNASCSTNRKQRTCPGTSIVWGSMAAEEEEVHSFGGGTHV